MGYDNNATVLFSVNGDRSKNIKVTKTDYAKAKTKTAFAFGAAKSSIEFK